MLKTLLLSGWFRVQPFFKYVVVVTLLAPVVAASAYSTSAKHSQTAKNTPAVKDSEVPVAAVAQDDLAQVLKTAKIAPTVKDIDSESQSASASPDSELLQADLIESLLEEGIPQSDKTPDSDALAAVELAPPTQSAEEPKLDSSQLDLVARLKAAKQEIAAANQEMPAPLVEDAAKSTSVPGDTQEQTQTAEQQDPINSPFAIPWQWIQATHQAIAAQGGTGVRYYRSVPVVSPDGRYAVYSRVQLEVKPELYNSRVSSVLFVEDLQTKKLRIVSSTSRNCDSLLNVKVAEDPNGQGTIGVLVPVSWSQSGDRFLARQFEGVLSTSDASDRAVIWEREQNRTNTVAPAVADATQTQGQAEAESEKMSVLLGWSKTQPGRVLFRTGEMGSEQWPVVSVAHDGTTVAAETDQPITYGQITQVWANPQVAYR